ncbi:unnamed protein product [Rotaria sordida]|uniref:AD domain-containing protein n=1 Tax=Rotaria sordida TaxID=392033 RepID=A0A815YSI5_9BILA|nr:unnamed protein product [Rotaria sordida]CAF1574813.1 unnamed protein product [Rotaria sordida]
MGDYSKALEFYEKSLKIYENALPPNHPDLATSYNNIGDVIVLIDDTSNRVHIVLRPDIIPLKILDRNISHQLNKDPFLPSNSTIDNQDESICDRLGKNRKFLSSKRIPFQEKLEENNSITLLIQNGIVQINSPYKHENISGTNEIVLSRIKLLFKQIIN